MRTKRSEPTLAEYSIVLVFVGCLALAVRGGVALLVGGVLAWVSYRFMGFPLWASWCVFLGWFALALIFLPSGRKK